MTVIRVAVVDVVVIVVAASREQTAGLLISRGGVLVRACRRLDGWSPAAMSLEVYPVCWKDEYMRVSLDVAVDSLESAGEVVRRVL